MKKEIDDVDSFTHQSKPNMPPELQANNQSQAFAHDQSTRSSESSPMPRYSAPLLPPEYSGNLEHSRGPSSPPPTPPRRNIYFNLNNITQNGPSSSSSSTNRVTLRFDVTNSSTTMPTCKSQATAPISPFSRVATTGGQFSTTVSPKTTTTMNDKSACGRNNCSPLNTPALPPHRSYPAPLLPKRNSNCTSSDLPPTPPPRHSSLRGCAALTPITSPTFAYQHRSKTSFGDHSSIDLETRFDKLFHNVSEFPAPQPFLNISKVYPSQQKIRDKPQTRVNTNI